MTATSHHRSESDPTTTEVTIAGAGADGLMLACELALAGIRTVVLDHQRSADDEPQADRLPGPAVRLVDHRGLYERLADATGATVPQTDPVPHAALPVPQSTLAAVLAQRVDELGVPVRRGHELIDFEQDDATVTVAVTGPEGPYRLRTEYLVRAGGGHGVTRERAGTRPTGARPSGTVPAARRLRDRRVFLIGDAPHEDGATGGGSGLERGLADAFNLGWKLAAAVLGDAGPDLLDSYERERRPVPEPSPAARLDTVDDGGARVGRIAPEMTLQTRGGPVRLAELTTRALPLLVDRTEPGSLATAIAPWHDEVDVVRAHPEVAERATTALFLRPDCHVAWASTSSTPTPAERDALRAAAERWLGPRQR